MLGNGVRVEGGIWLCYNRAMTLSHVDSTGHAKMVDVGNKPDSERIAVAKGEVTLKSDTLALIQSGGMPKGDVFTVAQIAGIMGAKRTSEFIPMCHPLLITDAEVKFDILNDGKDTGSAIVGITSTVKNSGKTGVEMEALVAVCHAALTVYDMVKAVDRGVRINNVRLVFKSGGRSGETRLE